MKQLHPVIRRQEKYGIVIVQIHLRSEADLAKIAQVLRDPRLLLYAGVNRKGDRDQNGDDCDDNEQFDKGEAAAGIISLHRLAERMGFRRLEEAKIKQIPEWCPIKRRPVREFA